MIRKVGVAKWGPTVVLTILVALYFSSLSVLGKDLKIGLIISEHPVAIGSDGRGILLNLFNNQPIADVKGMESYTVQSIRELVSVSSKVTGSKLGAFTGPVKLASKEKNGLVCCNKRCYRGELIIFPGHIKSSITVVNNVDLEDYLLSVVPSEIPSSWNKEVLKAQVVAARSYTLGYLGRRKEKGYDLESTVEDQVYLGVASERRATTEAVNNTHGTVLLDKDGKPLIALYHSSAGGYTDSIENLWDKKPSVHIQPRPDYDDNSPHFQWHRNYRLADVNKLLSSLGIGETINIVPLSRSVSERVTYLKLIGTLGTITVRGEEFRKYLKLPSSKFNLLIEDGYIKLAGRGFGHGLGLSQWGAKALAESGFTYEQILAHYYPGARLATVVGE